MKSIMASNTEFSESLKKLKNQFQVSINELKGSSSFLIALI